MALAVPVLDDLTWEDLVQVARSRIPAASGGAWTLHSPTDPGITLLELFAAQLEERLYWLDQPSDPRQRAILKLLGIQPQPVSPAATVLAFLGKSNGAPSFEQVPAQLRVCPQPPPTSFAPMSQNPRDAKSVPEFTTLNAIQFLPMNAATGPPGASVNLILDGKDYSRDLHMGKGVRLWIDPDGAADVDIELLLAAELPAKLTGTVGLFLDVETTSTTTPQWLPGASLPDPPATLTWAYQKGPDVYQAFDTGAVQDGTRGLRRAGVVRLTLPAAMTWQRNAASSYPFAYRLRLTIRDAKYPAPPRLRQIVPNAVIARHVRRVRASQDEVKMLSDALGDWSPVQTPGPMLSLPDEGQPVVPTTVRLALKQGADKARCWRPVEDFSGADAGERVFVVCRETGRLTFGDGYNGRLPVNASVERLSYWVGGGRGGNLSAGRTWKDSGFAWTAVNVVDATGGADAESLADASRRAAYEWRRPTRCVTTADCEALALATPGVAVGRAHAVVGRDPQFPCTPVEGALTVYVVPDVPRPADDEWLKHPELWAAPVPDAPSLALVQQWLEAGRLVAQQLFVQPPLYQSVSVAVTIGGIPVDPDQVRADVTLKMYQTLHPLWGGADETGWEFGGPVYPSEIMERVQDVLPTGLLAMGVAVARADDPASATDCEPLAIGAHQLPRLTRVQIRFVAQAQLEGGFG